MRCLEDSNQQWQASTLSTPFQVISLRRPGLAAVQKIMGWTPLHLAAAEGEVQLMESLIQEHGCDHLARSVNSWTPLHYAAAHNQVLARSEAAHCVWQCLPTSPCRGGTLEVYCASAHQEGAHDRVEPYRVQVEAIRYLVKAGCPADVQDSVASTPLHIAAGEGHTEAIRVLVSLVRHPSAASPC